jgi:hypothetical protein
MTRTKKNSKAAADALKASIARHNRYADIELQLSTMDRDENPSLVCDLEIELASLADAIAKEV